MHGDQPDDGLERLEHHDADEADDEQRLGIDREPMGDDRPPGKHDDEGQKVKCERHDPEERHRRNVDRDMRGDGHQQAGRYGGERHPGCGIPPGRGRRFGGFARGGVRQPCGGAPEQRAAAGDQREQEEVTQGPKPRLVAQPHKRLDQHRIGQQRQETADVAGGVKEIGVAGGGVAGAREPRLQQRRIGRQCKERQSDRHSEQADQPERFADLGRAAPARRDGERQRRHRRSHHGEVHDHHPAHRKIAGQRMGVGIAGEQRRLKEHDCHRPDGRRAAEPRQHHLGEHRLHREQQRGTDEDRAGEDGEQQAIGARRRARRLVQRKIGSGHVGNGTWIIRGSQRPGPRRMREHTLFTCSVYLFRQRYAMQSAADPAAPAWRHPGTGPAGGPAANSRIAVLRLRHTSVLVDGN